MIETFLIGAGLVFAGFQLGKLWAAYKIVKNPMIVAELLAEHCPDRIRVLPRSSEED